MTNLTIQINKENCVKCGKCLAVCPFYKSFQTEEYSPRGRFVIFQQKQTFPLYCIGCLKCKSVCPFDLSPIETFSFKFIWKNIFIESINDYLKTLFDIIYNPYKKPIFYSSPKGLLELWAIKRGFLQKNINLSNQIIYNPFADCKYKNLNLFNEKKEMKKIWKQILKEAEL